MQKYWKSDIIFTGPVINYTFNSNGTYLLYLKINKSIGVVIRKRELTIEEGYYIYVGSAFSAGGLASRIHRHLRRRKKRHWHIDQVTMSKHCSIQSVAAFFNEKIECQIAQKLSSTRNLIPIKDFGNSDCKNGCFSHFFQVE